LADGCKVAGSSSTVGSTRLSLGLEVLIREALQQITPEIFLGKKKQPPGDAPPFFRSPYGHYMTPTQTMHFF